MSKKSLVQREIKRRSLVDKFSFLRKSLKSEIIRNNIFNEKVYSSFKLQKLPRNSSLIRLLC